MNISFAYSVDGFFVFVVVDSVFFFVYSVVEGVAPARRFPFLISSPLSMTTPTIDTCMIVTIFCRIFS